MLWFDLVKKPRASRKSIPTKWRYYFCAPACGIGGLEPARGRTRHPVLRPYILVFFRPNEHTQQNYRGKGKRSQDATLNSRLSCLSETPKSLAISDNKGAKLAPFIGRPCFLPRSLTTIAFKIARCSGRK